MELTEQQLQDLYNKGNEETKTYLKELYPDAFKLEVGKWYIMPNHFNVLMNITHSSSDKFNFYGVDYYDNWTNNDYYYVYEAIKNGVRLATPEEVETALINEAKKRGFKDDSEFISLFSDRGNVRRVERIEDWYFNPKTNKLHVCTNELTWGDNGNCSNPTIFENGKWAEVIELKEEKPNVLDYLTKKLDNLLDSISEPTEKGCTYQNTTEANDEFLKDIADSILKHLNKDYKVKLSIKKKK